ncbi:hypothetical protein A9K55_002367 [Cordyceps militaris]|uniref:Uncharacterized protein n=1 Tax=Cordyceps militaris TaxID=73501 RepID=A0A2H4S8J0_CORMI|nr:hypothetical protein A9K55_002367 [Cordyceps militaris]
MVWPLAAETMPTTVSEVDATLWTQESTSTAATVDDDYDDDDGAWSHPASPAWEAGNLPESPYIPSAQPVFYPFSPPASGIGPLTPVRRLSNTGNSWVSELDTDSEVEEMVDDMLQVVSGMVL